MTCGPMPRARWVRLSAPPPIGAACFSAPARASSQTAEEGRSQGGEAGRMRWRRGEEGAEEIHQGVGVSESFLRAGCGETPTPRVARTLRGGGSGVVAAGLLLPTWFAMAPTPLEEGLLEDGDARTMRCDDVGVAELPLRSSCASTSTSARTLAKGGVGVAELVFFTGFATTPTPPSIAGLLAFLFVFTYRRTPTCQGVGGRDMPAMNGSEMDAARRR